MGKPRKLKTGPATRPLRSKPHLGAMLEWARVV